MYNINIVILCTWTVFVNSFSKGIDGFLFFYYNEYAGNGAGATEYAARRKAQEGRLLCCTTGFLRLAKVTPWHCYKSCSTCVRWIFA